MASRGMSASMLSEIVKQETHHFHAVHLETDPGLYITTCYKQLSFGSQTWSPLGQLLKVPTINESISINANTVSLKLSGFNQSMIAAVLAHNLINQNVKIYLGFLNSSSSVIDSPLQIFDGKVSDWSIVEDSSKGSSVVDINLTSHWVDFEKTSGRRTNDQDQQSIHPGDDGMRHTSQIIKDLEWL